MKQQKLLRYLGMIVLLTLLMAVIPAAPALGAATLTISPTQAKVGQSVSFTAALDYTVSSTDYYFDMFMSDQSATAGTMNVTITRYNRVIWGGYLDDGVSASGSFVIPATLNEGVVGEASPHTVTAGTTYYIYACGRYTNPYVPNVSIRAVASLIISPGASLDPLNPITGPAGTTVSVSGGNFPASAALAFMLDTTTPLTPTGDITTRASGIFISTITIPAGTAAGAHTITVTAGTSTATATFTVTAAATIDTFTPASGAAGSLVTITGANFLANTPIQFKFDTAPLIPNSGAQTGPGGTVASVITIPASAAVGAHTVSVTVGTVTISKEFSVTSTSAANAAINLSATSGAANSDITISGTDFPAGSIVITFGGTNLPVKSGSTQASGGVFSSVVTIPSGTTTGAKTITVTVGSASASAQFTVTPPSTTTPPASKAVLSINQTGHTVGSDIGIGGAGFTPGATVTIKYDNTQVATVLVGTNGTFVSPFFKAPPSAKGDHTITATDGVNTATAIFTMESTMPKVPPPLEPKDGAKAKSPVTFDWKDVIDDSAPVTYQLQIATDKNFTATSLVLDKSGIASSSYIMSELEELKLAGVDTPYYWRVQAIDAASNASGWTGAGTFYVPGPFTFPDWGIYVGAAAGAIIFFLLGMWIGRRTAFMY